MKRKIVPFLILALLNLWLPYANAEISQDLDPMVSPDVQTVIANENPAENTDQMAAGQTGNAVSDAGAVKAEKKVEEPKKKKTKKSSVKKSSSKKSKKTSSKKSKKTKKTKKSSR